jgi:PAS domain S-box-containing protein
LFDNVVDGVFQMTLDGRLISANPALVRLLGYDSKDELGDASLADFCVEAKDHDRLVKELTAYGRVRNYEYGLRRHSGSVIVVVQNSRIVEDDAGNILYCEGIITDVTQRKAAERALFEEKERAEVTLKSIGDAVVTTDAEGTVAYLNPVAEQLTGWERREARGKPIEEVIQLKDDVNGEVVESPVLRCLRERRIATLAENAVLVARDGSTVAIQDSAAPIQDHDGNVVGAVLVFHDVSQERQLHRKLSYYASHDSLTGLINRREFEERLSAALRSAKHSAGQRRALLYMDLDQFKVVNDTCGHAAGDLLLRQLADLLRQRVRTSDVIARLGGDEFAVLLTDCSMAAAAEAADLLRRSR